jgi:hypothetical protein
VANLIDGTTPIPENGDTGWGATLNAAINAIDGRFTYQSPSSIPATKALASGIVGTTLASNVVTSSLTSVGTLASLAVTGNVTIGGNLTISGTTTTVNTATLNVADNIVMLNSDVTGAPSENAGIEVNRGTSADVFIRWNETTDTWEFTNDGTNYLQLSPGAPVTKTSNFTLAATENNVICDGSGTITVTFPSAASFIGRVVYIKTIAAQTVVSASSNVVPISSAVAGTAILAASAGSWARLVSDGTNWVVMAS